MTLGVYGDSFSTKSRENTYTFWVEEVANKLNISFKNYSELASSLFYSYNLFLETHEQHEKVIFAITGPDRYTKPINLSSTGSQNHHISSPGGIIQIKKRFPDLSLSDKHTLMLINHWFMSMDEKFHKICHELIVNDIINKRPDAIIIPCFEQSLTTEQRINAGFDNLECLYNLIKLQCQSLGLKKEPNWDVYIENKDIVNGHLTPELNKILGELVYNRIVNKIWDRFPTKEVKHQFTWDVYYKNYE